MKSLARMVFEAIATGRGRRAQRFIDAYLADRGLRSRFAEAGIELPLEPSGGGTVGGGPARVPAGAP